MRGIAQIIVKVLFIRSIVSLRVSKFILLKGWEMDSKSIPELLKRSLQSHMAEADLREDEETQDIIAKLSVLSDKVAEAKARALANRAQRLAEEAKG
jgi:homoserine dehydrogenase